MSARSRAHEWTPIPAILSDVAPPGCRREWTANLHLPVGRHELVVRAQGLGGESQPADPATLWNVRGYMNNAWTRASIEIFPD